MHFLFPKSQTHIIVCLSGPSHRPSRRPAPPGVFIGVEAGGDHRSSINKLPWASSEPTEAQSFHRPFTWSRLAGRTASGPGDEPAGRGGPTPPRGGGSTWQGGKEMFGLIINPQILLLFFFVLFFWCFAERRWGRTGEDK